MAAGRKAHEVIIAIVIFLQNFSPRNVVFPECGEKWRENCHKCKLLKEISLFNYALENKIESLCTKNDKAHCGCYTAQATKTRK